MSGTPISGLALAERSIVGLGYNLSLHEQRIIYLSILKNRKENMPLDGVLEIKASEYAELFSQTQKTANNIFQCVMLNNWAKDIDFNSLTNTLFLQFTPKAVEFVTILNERLTDPVLQDLLKLTNRNAFRLYELSAIWFADDSPLLPITTLRKLIGIVTYKDLSSFRKLLNLAVKNIQENTPKILEYSHEIKGANEQPIFKFSLIA